MANTAYDIVTDRIIFLLEKGVIPWRKPWHSKRQHPRSLTTGQKYRGINVILLGCHGWPNPYWITYRQALELGGHVRKGEHASPIVFWKRLGEDATKNPSDPVGDDVASTVIVPKRVHFLLRYYNVFNVDQCEGLPADKAPLQILPAVSASDGIMAAKSIIDRLPANSPAIRHGQDQAYYRHCTDMINMPPPNCFDRPENYYSTLFHELTHATGHETRLNRKGIAQHAAFGDEVYSQEELVAEMGATFLCSHVGLLDQTAENSASYIAGWINKLKHDRRMIVIAAGQAQKAADWLLGAPTQDTD